ncbi:unnamed protein product, partial [Arabidopsis halleri]
DQIQPSRWKQTHGGRSEKWLNQITSTIDPRAPATDVR